MAKLPIVTVGAPVLEQKAVAVPRITKKITKLIDDMLETMYEANGIGLAAPQVGVSQRIVVLDVGEGPIVLVNPEIGEVLGEEIDVEGCLSVPDRWVYVKRPTTVEVTGRNEKGKTIRLEADGLLARALQHEIDHLDGILMLQRMIGEAVMKEVEDQEEDVAGSSVDDDVLKEEGE